MSDARRPQDVLTTAGRVLEGYEGDAVAVLWS
jgi:hypothetical protein